GANGWLHPVPPPPLVGSNWHYHVWRKVGRPSPTPASSLERPTIPLGWRLSRLTTTVGLQDLTPGPIPRVLVGPVVFPSPEPRNLQAGQSYLDISRTFSRPAHSDRHLARTPTLVKRRKSGWWYFSQLTASVAESGKTLRIDVKGIALKLGRGASESCAAFGGVSVGRDPSVWMGGEIGRAINPPLPL
ncbi:hypothetical protein BX600DRAFT_462183, partial [Xylariales sp. PMI_506]